MACHERVPRACRPSIRLGVTLSASKGRGAQVEWWARKESDLRPLHYQCSALPLSYAPGCDYTVAPDHPTRRVLSPLEFNARRVNRKHTRPPARRVSPPALASSRSSWLCRRFLGFRRLALTSLLFLLRLIARVVKHGPRSLRMNLELGRCSGHSTYPRSGDECQRCQAPSCLPRSAMVWGVAAIVPPLS